LPLTQQAMKPLRPLDAAASFFPPSSDDVSFIPLAKNYDPNKNFETKDGLPPPFHRTRIGTANPAR